MPETRVIEETIYTFDELSESGKDRARQDANLFYWDSGNAHEDMQLIADNILTDNGFEGADDLEYQLYSQGQVNFGTRGMFGDYLVAVSNNSHQSWIEVFNGEEFASDITHKLVRDEIVRIANEIESAMYTEDEYRISEEAVREDAEANKYRYYENGVLA